MGTVGAAIFAGLLSSHYPPAQGGILINPYSIAQDATAVYVGNNENPARVYRIIKETLATDINLALAANEANAIDVAVNGSYCFVICRNTGTGNARVIRLDKATFANKLTIDLGTPFGAGLAIDGNNLYVCTAAAGGVGSRITIIDIPTFAVVTAANTYTAGLTQSPYTLINYPDIGFPSRLVQDATYLYFGSSCQFGAQSPGSITRVKKSDLTFTVLIIDNVTAAKSAFGFAAVGTSSGNPFIWASYQSAAPQGMIRLSLTDFFTYTYRAAIGGANSQNMFSVSRETTDTSVLTGVSFVPVAQAQYAAVLKDLSAVTLTNYPNGGERVARGICYDSDTDNRYDLVIINAFNQGRVYRS